MTTSSERPSASSSRQNSTSSTDSTLNKTWRKIKEHHEGLNDAFATYYGGGRRSQEAWTTPKYTSSRRTSISSQELEHKPLVGKKEGLGSKLKHMVKEHHRSVNNAYRAYYGY